MRNFRRTACTVLSASLLAIPVHGQSTAQPASTSVTPGVDLWLDTDFYETRSKAEAYFNAAPGSYVAIVRVSTNNTLEVLYPASPAAQQPYVRTPQARTALPFRTDPANGLGLLFGISSDKPLDFSKVSENGRWKRDRLAHPVGQSPSEFAGYFFNDITTPASRFSLAQTSFINGAVTYRVGDPGFPTVSAVIDAAGIACNWNEPDNTGHVCGLRKGDEPGTSATPPARTPSAYDELEAARLRCAKAGAVNHDPSCADIGVMKREPKPPPPPPPPPPPSGI